MLPSDQELDRIADRLAAGGAIALILVDAARLARVERQYGGEAYLRARQGLADLVRDLLQQSVPSDDVLVTVERGGDEVHAYVFRPRGDREFYGARLLEISRQLTRELERQAGRAVYPYFRDPLALSVGLSVAVHNPNIRPERQLLNLVEQGRRDAELQARLDARVRGWRLLGVVLGGDLEFRFEPIVDLRTREAIGYEALARGPEGSELHMPRQIFGIAEEMGLLFELDCLCRRSALERAHVLPGGKKLFLNCLPTAIRDPGFRGDGLRKTLEKLQLNPSDLVLEISEKESIENFAIFREMRDSYREFGIHIAIDDAGVGYASLERIMEVSPDYLKADMALVRGIDTDPARQEVLRALQAVARRIRAEIIAEGVETEDELRVLVELGIPYAQGYLFGQTLSSSPAAPTPAVPGPVRVALGQIGRRRRPSS